MARNKKPVSKVTPPTPNVFVVPELMADGPAEPGGLFREYLEIERLGANGSARERIEAYLRDPGVARKPADEPWPKANELAAMSGVERQRWLGWEAQHWVDSSLRKLLNGKAPREVFKLDARKRSRPTTAARDRNMCAEVLRLIERCDYTRAEAVARVAEAFSISVQVVERASELCAWDAQAKKERRRFVPIWEQRLRNAGKLE
jgi:hypothetical protein